MPTQFTITTYIPWHAQQTKFKSLAEKVLPGASISSHADGCLAEFNHGLRVRAPSGCPSNPTRTRALLDTTRLSLILGALLNIFSLPKACADSKVKCDLQFPCSKCSVRGKECTFLNDPETARTRRAAKNGGGRGSPDSTSSGSEYANFMVSVRSGESYTNGSTQETRFVSPSSDLAFQSNCCTSSAQSRAGIPVGAQTLTSGMESASFGSPHSYSCPTGPPRGYLESQAPERPQGFPPALSSDASSSSHSTSSAPSGSLAPGGTTYETLMDGLEFRFDDADGDMDSYQFNEYFPLFPQGGAADQPSEMSISTVGGRSPSYMGPYSIVSSSTVHAQSTYPTSSTTERSFLPSSSYPPSLHSPSVSQPTSHFHPCSSHQLSQPSSSEIGSPQDPRSFGAAVFSASHTRRGSLPQFTGSIPDRRATYDLSLPHIGSVIELDSRVKGGERYHTYVCIPVCFFIDFR